MGTGGLWVRRVRGGLTCGLWVVFGRVFVDLFWEVVGRVGAGWGMVGEKGFGVWAGGGFRGPSAALRFAQDDKVLGVRTRTLGWWVGCRRLGRMLLERVVEAEYAEVVALANLAYRGTGSAEGAAESWNIEAGLVGGPRLTEETLREELVEHPDLLVWREVAGGPLMGTVWMQDRARVFGIWGCSRCGLMFRIGSWGERCWPRRKIGPGAGWAADYDDGVVGEGCADGVV